MVHDMGPLKNPKRELFARGLAEIGKTGGSHGSAYARAGYRCTNGAAEAAASRMLADVKNGVADRVRELMAGGAKRAEVTVASLLNELEQARAAAHSDGQFSAAVAAIAGKAKLSGCGAENGGSGSEFSKCETISDLMRVLMASESASSVLESLDVLRAEVIGYAANNATVIPATEPARPREPGTEADRSLALFRRRR
jgi:hypothetical protein